MLEVCIYVEHGYFSYEVGSVEKALAHGETIMRNGTYRRVNENNEVEIHKVYKVKLRGEGLETEYPDKFNRT